jgi:hypothetical protein
VSVVMLRKAGRQKSPSISTTPQRYSDVFDLSLTIIHFQDLQTMVSIAGL